MFVQRHGLESIPQTTLDIADSPHLSLARISLNLHGLRGAVPPTGQESRAARCWAPGKRLDAPCRRDRAALRVAPRRLPAASRASTVALATLFGPLLAGRPPGRDADRGICENCGLAVAGPHTFFAGGGVIVKNFPA